MWFISAVGNVGHHARDRGLPDMPPEVTGLGRRNVRHDHPRTEPAQFGGDNCTHSHPTRRSTMKFEIEEQEPKQEQQEKQEARDVNLVASDFLSLVRAKTDEAQASERSVVDKLTDELAPLIPEAKKL